MATLATLSVLCLLPQAPSRGAAMPPAEIVLSQSGDPVCLTEFGLGDGGIPPGERGELHFVHGGCTTAGGVRVDCRSVGVRLAFPSGRELLVATDGAVHLRSGEVAGPFPAGLELRLGDGAAVRITLSQGASQRMRDVTVQQDGRALQPWRRGEPAAEVGRPGGWAGVRFFCCGDGGDLYRGIALGPLVVLDRALVAQDRAEGVPAERLVVLTAPLRDSLAQMQRQHRQRDVAVRQAVATVAAVADRGDIIFPAGAALPRVERDKLRWQLGSGCELELDLEGQQAPRLALFAQQHARPLVEWTLHGDSAAFLTNPCDDQLEKRWFANGTRLPRVASDLQARQHLFERGHALRVIGRLRR